MFYGGLTATLGYYAAMCFDQAGERMRRGGDYSQAEKNNTYPVWWVWPDQIAPLLMDNVNKINALERSNEQIQDTLQLALHVIRCIPEATLNELADQQLQVLNKSLEEM